MKLNLSEKTQKIIAFFLISGFVLILTSILSLFSPVSNLELKVLNQQFRLRGIMEDRDTSIVIVNIDDQTFTTLASMPLKWPYPRSIYAKLIQNLNDELAPAKLIIFDLEFSDPSSDPYQDEIVGLIANEYNNVIFAGKLVTEISRSMTVNQYVEPPIPEISGYSLTDSSALPWGLVNIVEDDDGFLRRYFLSQFSGDIRYYPLSILAAKTLLNLSEGEIIDNENTFNLGDISVPKVTSETMMINYAGPAKTFKTFSLSNILDDFEFDLGEEEDTDIFDLHKMWGTFTDKIVFIGSSAEELQDTKFAPFYNYDGISRKMPGVEVHANALNTILTKNFLQHLPKWLGFLMITAFVLLVGLTVFRFKPLRAGGITLFMVLVFVICTYYSFSLFNRIVPLVTPLIAIVLSYFGSTAYLYATEQKEKIRYRKIFQQYVSKDIVEEMLGSGKFPSFGGERKLLTVLFSDIRSFTNFSEQYPPEEIVQRLSEYLTEMSDILIENDGTLDKFVGDEIMAIFGAPFLYDDHAEKACRAAFQMTKALKKRQKEYSKRGQEYFNIGIGINTGDMVVGNLGSQQLFDYTVIGDAVNLGARLEGVNKFYGTNIIISESTKEAVTNKIIVRELDTIKVKGKDEPIRIYELLGTDKIPKKERTWLLETYQEGLKFYSEKKWYDCLREMNRVLRHFPEDGPSKLYIQRSLEMIETPPAEDWEPVYKFETK